MWCFPLRVQYLVSSRSVLYVYHNCTVDGYPRERVAGRNRGATEHLAGCDAGLVGQGPFDGVVALVRHTAEDESVRRSTAHRLAVQHHHVHGGGDGVRVSMGDHR